MANFVVESHIRHHPSNDLEEMERQGLEADSIADLNENTPGGVEKIPQELLKKYIIYAKEKVHPKLHNMDQVRLMKICMIEFTDEKSVMLNRKCGWARGSLSPWPI